MDTTIMMIADSTAPHMNVAMAIPATAPAPHQCNWRVFLQRVSIACYAERCISYDRFCRPSDRPTVWPSVCHTLVSCQNDSS